MFSSIQISVPSFQTIGVLVGTIGFLRVVQAYLDFRRVRGTLGNLPGHRTIVDSTTVFGNLCPPLPGLALGHDHIWKAKHSSFVQYGADIISAISLWPKVKARLMIADAQAVKEIVWARGRFPKPLHQYIILTFFGENIVVSEGDEWKRYRKIVAPAFSERNNRLVWEETTQIMLDLFNNAWEGQDTITYNHGVDLTLPIALFVIGAAGFGRRISWKDDVVIPAGHQLTFKDALHSVTTNLLTKLLIPRWAMGLTKRWQHTRLAFDELQQYLLEMINERRNAEKKEERHDLLNSLIVASENEGISGGDVKLSDSELIGNIFIFLVAGHETTAHSLCFAFAMLALYPEEQEALYQHIQSVLPDGKLPTYDDMPLLTRSTAVFLESLRMFAPVTGIPKTSAEDTSIVTTDVNGEKRTVYIPQATSMTLDVVGLHYNPRYWEDPHTFKPSRFLGDWNRDAFLPFSSGYRACVGRKFSETEGTAVLTLLVSRFKIEIKEESQFAAETFEQRKARVLDARSIVTLAPIRAPLVFKRRV
ncbi:cytochrome P450 [Hygrophoropsis aurantiaca]|uniref:Cytochrome P450 n=1 Tax=Hygrophoropsis aurantiaca TaxID=72124 RepID=A0ACB7ZXK6_9AGAM|nr:cytochrome P450 [Hygrophoropsis aurantiaca]